MKHLARTLSLLILVSAGLFFANCGGTDPNPASEEETQLNKFKASGAAWTITDANDGTDRKDEYTGAKVTFSGTFSAGGTYSYTTTAPTPGWTNPSPWKKDANWKFKSGSVGNKIIRTDDTQEMGYAFSNGDKTLTITFNYTGTGFNNGRINSVAGDWTYVLTRP